MACNPAKPEPKWTWLVWKFQIPNSKQRGVLRTYFIKAKNNHENMHPAEGVYLPEGRLLLRAKSQELRAFFISGKNTTSLTSLTSLT
jgi:hypothetical protein